MNSIKLLIVEDDAQELEVCQTSIAMYKEERGRQVEILVCSTVEDALSRLDNTFDGAIIDLKLGDEGNEGNQIIERIADSYFRIPIAILTGTPDAADDKYNYIGVFKKGDENARYSDLLDRFYEIYSTGLTRIMGGRGLIEETLNKVFLSNILPQIETWKKYGSENSAKTETALLRHIMGYLCHLLDWDDESSFPEEMYLYPPLDSNIRPGSILQNTTEVPYVVMSPACDLVRRKSGAFKTDRILLAEIEKDSSIVDLATDGCSAAGKRERKLKELSNNNYTHYYHWLPKTEFFDGGFINFRKLSSFSPDLFEKEFKFPYIQISSFYMKDIVSRFSSYYARQGQPDLRNTAFIDDFK